MTANTIAATHKIREIRSMVSWLLTFAFAASIKTSSGGDAPATEIPRTIHQSQIFSKPLPAKSASPSSGQHSDATSSFNGISNDNYDANLTLRQRLQTKVRQSSPSQASSLLFDLPITYNKRVSYWVSYYQTKGKSWFADWLERANRFMPLIQKDLKSNNLPQDLAYMVMIESGFQPNAVSHADAVGPWQFILPTGERYGLRANWWLDERRDLRKSTLAAAGYIRDLYKEFGSWYLVAASYNMGETGLRRQINKHKTKDFWELSRRGALPQETMDYVPKILAAMMIAKAPTLYGFRDYAKLDPIEYEICSAPGGTDLNELADHLGVTHKSLKDLNAEIVLGYIPRQVAKHMIRVPKGSVSLVAEYLDDKARNPKR